MDYDDEAFWHGEAPTAGQRVRALAIGAAAWCTGVTVASLALYGALRLIGG